MFKHRLACRQNLIPTLYLVVILLVAANLPPFLAGHRFDTPALAWLKLDGEHLIPRLLGCSLLLSCSATTALLIERDGPGSRLAWYGLSLLLALLASEQLLPPQSHLAVPIADAARGDLPQRPGKLFAYGIATAVGLGYLRFLVRLPHGTRGGLLASAVIYLGGDLLLDPVAGGYLLQSLELGDPPRELAASAAEALQLLGSIWLLRALQTHADETGRPLPYSDQAVPAAEPESGMPPAVSRET